MTLSTIVTLRVGFQQLLHTALQNFLQQRPQGYTYAHSPIRQFSLPFMVSGDQ